MVYSSNAQAINCRTKAINGQWELMGINLASYILFEVPFPVIRQTVTIPEGAVFASCIASILNYPPVLFSFSLGKSALKVLIVMQFTCLYNLKKLKRVAISIGNAINGLHILSRTRLLGDCTLKNKFKSASYLLSHVQV